MDANMNAKKVKHLSHDQLLKEIGAVLDVDDANELLNAKNLLLFWFWIDFVRSLIRFVFWLI